MPRSKPIFIVEGELEKEFLQKHCETRSIIRKIPSNGIDVPIVRLVEMIVAILGLLRNPALVLIILDRESRVEEAHEIETLILNALNVSGAPGNISVHIADRMIENWILADPSALESENLTCDLVDGFDGHGGKAKLKKAFRQNGMTYSERIDGVRLLSKCSPNVMKSNSASFTRLLDRLLAENISCPWLVN